MIRHHDAAESVPPLFAHEPDPPDLPRPEWPPGPPAPRNDATPLAGGAGVNEPATSREDTLVWVRATPALRRNAPDTSRLAAARIAGHAPKQSERVYTFIRSHGETGATDAEVAIGCGIPIQSVKPRRGELEKARAIVLNGQRRPTPSNRPARVWVATEFAPKPATSPTIDPAAPLSSGSREGSAG